MKISEANLALHQGHHFTPLVPNQQPRTSNNLSQQNSTPMAEPFLLYEGGVIASRLRSNVTRVRISPQVTAIDNGAFYRCINLTNVHFTEGLQILGDDAFRDCNALRSVAVPLSVTKLGRRAFFRCSNLAELQLNKGLQVVGESAFAECAMLRSVTIPSTVTKLGHYAFANCSNLAEVHFTEGLQTIGEEAFWWCRALRSVTIPSTVAKLGRRAFGGCGNLSEVVLSSDERFLNRKFLVRGLEDQRLLNQESLAGFLLFYEGIEDIAFVFEYAHCPR